eukprot:13637335-Alexandrium_andersonii.AAC.1
MPCRRPGPGRGPITSLGLARGRPSPGGDACCPPVGSISGAMSAGGAPPCRRRTPPVRSAMWSCQPLTLSSSLAL